MPLKEVTAVADEVAPPAATMGGDTLVRQPDGGWRANAGRARSGRRLHATGVSTVDSAGRARRPGDGPAAHSTQAQHEHGHHVRPPAGPRSTARPGHERLGLTIISQTGPNTATTTVIGGGHFFFFFFFVSFGSYAEPPISFISTTLGEYGLADRAHEINLAGARIAREVADSFSTPDHPRFVAGSIGPGTKFPSLGQIRFADLRDQFEIQARGLIDGGVDVIIIETLFDLLAVKAAMIGSRRAMAAAGRQVPLQVQVTMELTGRMLPGTEIGAALAALDAMKPDVIGINCATGPAEMSEHLRHLSQHARMPISCIPNAGLPSVVDGHMHYDLTPEGLAEHQRRFVTELGVEVIGGCCGTTPAHLAAVVDTCRDLTPATRQPVHEAGATSIYSMVPFHQDTSFLIIGERTNANGSKKFREAMLEADWDTCVAMAKDQVKEGAHVLDVCVDYVGRDGTLDMDEVAVRFATESSAPLVLDSTEPQVLEAGLQWLGGRAILNSANLEDGEAEGSRLDRVFKLAREYGAAVICLLIDEEGQARDVEWKLRIAHRIHDLAVDRYGLEPSDLIFDALTFPLSTGDDDLRRDAMATIEAINRIKAELPGVHTTLGVSNVSFGLKPAARHVLNSVFLHECVQAGLDSAIVHAARIMPLNKIPEEQREVCLDLIYDRRRPASDDEPAYDPLQKLLAVFEDVNATEVVKEDRSDWTVERAAVAAHHRRRPRGPRGRSRRALAEGITPLAIINDVLLAGMKVVGELFGSGQMQLPFVLQSAETMKASVAYLEPHMEKATTRAARAASCWPRSRATCTTSARTWSTSSSPTTATRCTTSASRSRSPR